MHLTEPAPAKLNLALHLRRRRPDGYHDLETLFAFTQFGDTLTATPAETLTLTVTGPFAEPAGQGPDNLVLRAARALATAAAIDPNAALTLQKHIPVAAGLGGGSADAGAALRLLNRLWHLDWPLDRLMPIAASLGADVPACLVSQTRAGSGRGEVLTPWPASFTGTPALLVNPRVAVATGPVFAAWDTADRGGLTPAAPLAALRNDMTPAALAIAPIIGDVLAALAASAGTTLVRMSGSGATCFALYESPAARDAAAQALCHRAWWLAATQLI